MEKEMDITEALHEVYVRRRLRDLARQREAEVAALLGSVRPFGPWVSQ